MPEPPVRVRFAPSPTGFLHVGGARTALFNYLFARHYKGTFILRIEDTDLERSTEESTQQILDSLRWLGLHWDEGPFSQREQAPRHREVAMQLIRAGAAYRDFAPEADVEAKRQSAIAAKENYVYRGGDRDLPLAESEARAAAGESFCVRFRVPDSGTTVLPDGLAGDIVFEHAVLADFVLLRPDGSPVYNFACAVDDVDMRITHVIRGADHISNTPRQLLVIQAMGAEPPRYTHVPLIMKNGKKMSKRDADADANFPVSVHARRDLGYLPEAAVNFLALLGWSYDAEQEVFSIEQAIERFDGMGLTASAANFDEDKFTWMNAHYLRSLPREEVLARATAAMRAAGCDLDSRTPEWVEGIVSLQIERAKYLRDFAPALEYFFRPPVEFESKSVKKLFLAPGASARLRAVADCLEADLEFSVASIESRLGALCESLGEKFGVMAQPARLALTGRTATPGLFEIMHYLGRQECCQRLRDCAVRIEQGGFSDAGS